MFVKNQSVILHIRDLGNDGEGVGFDTRDETLSRFPVFVPGALPGELVAATILKVRKSLAYAKITDIIEPSPYRVEPVCPVYARCGGCSLQHLAYAQQLEYKGKKVRDCLSRIGGVAGDRGQDAVSIIPADEPLRYRNKAILPIGRDKSSNVSIGFYGLHSHNIVDVEDCMIQPATLAAIIRAVKGFISDNHISVYDEITGQGLARALFVRVGGEIDDQRHECEHMVGLVINGAKLPQSDAFVKCLLDTGVNICGIFANTNTSHGNAVLGASNKLLWGEDKLEVTLGGHSFGLSPLSFFQVNYKQCKKLYDQVLECARLTGNETLWDLYCGTGTIALYVASSAKKAIGIECVPDAVADARRNAVENGIENAEFHVGNAEDMFEALYEQHERESGADISHVVVLDPPRSGCDSRLLEAILRVKPHRIIYVSCDPATLARDVKMLCADGAYHFAQVTAVDMFPQTGHVESVAVMESSRSASISPTRTHLLKNTRRT